MRENRTQWFASLAKTLQLPAQAAFDLVAEAKIDERSFQDVRKATALYVQACFREPGGSLSEDALIRKLDAGLDRLANRTPNGVLLPKQEIQAEFNELHRAVASWLRGLHLDGLIYRLFCPITVRVVRGEASPQEAARPYASTKLHVDLWSGDPADNVVMSIPVLGDSQRTTVELFHPPDDFEKQWLRVLRDYNEGRELAARCEKYPVRYRPGHAYFWDAVVPHKTVLGEGGVRASLQFALRRPTTESERRKIEALCDPGRLSLYIDPDVWLQIGSTKLMQFKDTYADAAKGHFPEQPYNDPTYTIVDRP